MQPAETHRLANPMVPVQRAAAPHGIATMLQAPRRKGLQVSAHRLSAGVPMLPVSWQEMRCPKTRAVEKRKVAKVA